jgi:hypothetical protein
VIAERAKTLPQVVEQLALTRDQEDGVRPGCRDAHRRVGESIRALHRREPGHERHHGGIGGHRETSAGICARRRGRELDAGWDNHVLLGSPDLGGEQLVAHASADRDESRGAAREGALHAHNRAGHERREVAVQQMTVEGVHANGGVRQHRRRASEHSGLGGVGVHDVRAELSDCTPDRCERAQVTDRTG